MEVWKAAQEAKAAETQAVKDATAALVTFASTLAPVEIVERGASEVTNDDWVGVTSYGEVKSLEDLHTRLLETGSIQPGQTKDDGADTKF
jgi:hypothetical protein